jgi:hypothetical protein
MDNHTDYGTGGHCLAGDGRKGDNSERIGLAQVQSMA